MPENKFTDRPTGERFEALMGHINECLKCRVTINSKGQIATYCDMGYRLAMEWLQWQADHGDESAQHWLRGLEQQEKMG